MFRSRRRRGEPRPVDVVEFRDDDPGPVLARMRDLAAAHEGWVNLQPGIHPDDAPPAPTGISTLFAATSPTFTVPVATWLPGRGDRGRGSADTIGIQHGTGPRVVGRLAGAGVPLPPGWRWRQDHPRRGLVVELPPHTDPAAVVSWLTEAAEVLSLIPLTGDWRAEVHGPRPEGGGDGDAPAPASAPADAGPTPAGDADDGAPDLRGRWDDTLARWEVDPARSQAVSRHILDLYTGPRRAYHDVAHLRGVLDTLRSISSSPDDRYGDDGAVELAAWFHDAVLDPLAPDNEERSAELAEAELPRLGVPASVVAEVARLVRLTATHASGAGDRNAAALMDADLAVLGTAPDVYDAYRTAVRREYAAVSDAEFRPARAAVLRALLRGPLYRTSAMADREGPARANLERELTELESG